MTTVKPSPVDSPSIFLALLVTSLLILHSAMAVSPPAPALPLPPLPPAAECVRELVMFSPCLAFVSSPPNNLSASVSSACCDVYSATLANSTSSCLCYLLRDARMLGFPIDEDRVLSLSSVCARNDRSLGAMCSDPEAMAPSQNATDSGISSSPVSAPSLAPESDSPTEPPSPDSDDSGENSSPPSQQGAEMSLRRRKSPKTSKSPPGHLSSATGNQIGTGKWCFETGSLIFPLLMLVSYVALW